MVMIPSAAELVDNDGNVDFPMLQLPHKLADLFGFRDEVGRPDHILQDNETLVFHQPEEVLGIDDPRMLSIVPRYTGIREYPPRAPS